MGDNNFPKSFLIKGLDEKKYTDVQFCCPDDKFSGSSSVVRAHKTILTLASPVFEKMFTCPTFREHSEEVIEVPDIEATTFNALIDIIYGKDIQIDSYGMAIELYYAAEKYDIKEEVSGTYLNKQLETVDNIIPIYELCVARANQKYQEKCIQLFQTKTDSILSDSSFVTCHPTTLIKIFSLDSLFIVSELRLLQAYIKYLDVNTEAKNDIAKGLKIIRFLQIDAKDLAHISFLTADEIVKIIRIASDYEDESEMPLDLSTNRVNRCSKTAIIDDQVTRLIKKFTSGCCSNQHMFNKCGRSDKVLRKRFDMVVKKYRHLNFHTYSPEDFKILLQIYEVLK